MAPTLPKLKLTHFDARMRGESTRLALHVGNVPFEDERVSYKTVHDPGETWLTMKKTMPFRQMPVMTINGTTQISQSNGILRYAGTLGGLYPAADPLKAALVDQVVLHIDDMNMVIFPSIIERDNDKKTLLRKEIVEKKFPEMLSDLDKVLEKHSAGKWSVGDTLTVADLCVYVLIGLIKSGIWDGIPANMADKYTCVHRVYEAVRTHPKVVEWELAHKK
ncbi:hypothetical protein BASA61_000066 [Batrachochytrium salamandrivorans]|nr:hypothetical protein BASA61_000066 [Batrachochytrium salamandrivorans]